MLFMYCMHPLLVPQKCLTNELGDLFLIISIYFIRNWQLTLVKCWTFLWTIVELPYRNYRIMHSINWEHDLNSLSQVRNTTTSKSSLIIYLFVCNKGLATIKVRAPSKVGGTKLLTINVKLSEIGNTLQELVAKELGTCPLRLHERCRE